jgi:poly(hydroxyalkanoate) granule-associated protein
MVARTANEPWTMSTDLSRWMWAPWMMGLGAFLEIGRSSLDVMDKMIRQPDKLENEGQKAVDRAREGLGDMADSFEKRDREGFGDMAGSFESRVEQTLSQLRVPTRDDLDTLSYRLEVLAAEMSSIRSGRITYHVVPVEDGWAVKVAGDEGVLSQHEIKDDAINAARELGRANEPSRVIIHRRDGMIQTHHSYGDADT